MRTAVASERDGTLLQTQVQSHEVTIHGLEVQLREAEQWKTEYEALERDTEEAEAVIRHARTHSVCNSQSCMFLRRPPTCATISSRATRPRLPT